ncbi:MAG: 4Fe-4S dicluster domain-containing protein [Caldiserica bacterium]|nr:4Fe-4S dicluster domain-containing protein [Caldisericota bacterium]
MAKKRLVLTFPPSLVNTPVTYHLVKDYDLVVNILRARVTPEEEGKLVIDLEGEKDKLEKGVKYLSELGVHIQPLARDVTWNEENCTHCTACITICPTEALSVDKDTRKVSFDKEKCIACELCIPACPYQAMVILI